MGWRNPRWNSLRGPDAEDLRAIFESLQNWTDNPTFEKGINLGKADGSDGDFIYDAAKNVRIKPPLPVVGNDNLDAMLAGSLDWVTNGMVKDRAIDNRTLAVGAVQTNVLSVQVGGGNIAYNSAFIADANGDGVPDNWSLFSGTVSSTQGISAVVDAGVQGKALQLAAASSDSYYLAQDFTLPKGRWAVGCKVKRTSVTAGAGRGSGLNVDALSGTWTYVRNWETVSTANGFDLWDLIYTGTHDWRWEWVVIDVTSATASMRVYCQQGYAGNCTGTTWFGEVQVEPGDVATKWGPRIDEILPGTILSNMVAADQITGREIAATVLGVGKYIRSQGYVAGSAGWSADAAGNAEFNNVTVRGTVDASTVQGSTMITGAPSSGKRIVLSSSSHDMKMYLGVASEDAPARIDNSYTNVFGVEYATLDIWGPSLNAVAQPDIALIANNTTGKTSIVLTADSVGLPVPPWTNATLINGINNYGSPAHNARYCIDSEGFVHLEGWVQSIFVMGTTMFVLPAGLRPTSQVGFACLGDSGLARVDVDTSGNVIVVAGAISSGGWLFLDGITFSAF